MYHQNICRCIAIDEHLFVRSAREAVARTAELPSLVPAPGPDEARGH